MKIRKSSKRSVRASRASRVMAAKRSIHFTVTVTDTDEIIDVLEDQDEAIEVARKYTQKYGDSATVEKEWIGSDGEVYDSTVCFQTDGNSNSSRRIAKRRVMAASDDDPNFGDIAGLAKQSAYSYIVTARQGFERLLKFVDEVLRDEFNSSYRTAGTVSLGDTDTSAIFTITPVCDDEWLEDSALNIYYDVFGVEAKGFAGRPYRMVVKAAINDDVIAYGDNFDDIQVEVAQDIAESCRLNWDEFWNDDIESSTKIAKRPIKASRPIMAGAGAGITLELEDLTFTEVPNSGFYGDYNEYHEFLEPENGACKGTIEIKSIGTYYDGGNPNTGVIPVSIFVEEVIPYDAEDAQQMMGGTLKDVIDEFDEYESTIRIGGGWTRVTFDGTFEVEGYSGYSKLKLKVEIEDKDVVRWLDEFAHGESEDLFYDICINGDYQGNYYESMEDAIETAKEYADDPQYAEDEITVVIEHYNTDYNGENSGYFDDSGDVVWNSNDALYE